MNKKRFLLVISAFVMFLLPAKAQELLNEGFESGEFPSNGWTAQHDPNPEVTGHWRADDYMPMAGKFCLYIDEYSGPIVEGVERKKEVKKEYAITPSVTLPADQPYGVKFSWVANSIYVLDKPAYNYQVAVKESGATDWTVIWSANDKESVEASGIKFPWANWAKNTSTVSLDAYKGKTIQIAFIYDCWDADNGNMVRMDNVIVLPHDTPKPIVSGPTSYSFSAAYIGLKETSALSELFLSNSGVGEFTVTSIEGLEGTDFSTNLITGIKLGMQESVFYNVFYTPTEEGDRNAEMTIKTDVGGELKVALSGSKTGLNPGYTVESFEGVDFYPTGWTGKGFRLTTAARSGEKAANVSFENEATLTSPRLNLSSGNFNVVFDLRVDIDEESEYEPEDQFYLQQSKNGGNSWTTIWTYSVSPTYENLPYTRYTVPINNPMSDNYKLRWVYKLEGQLSYDMEVQNFYIDNIVLPPLYGTDGKPEIATNPTPANDAINQYVNDLKLSWRGALHAEGYKLYVGKDENNPNSVLDGERIGIDANSYTINGLDYNTKYYWKVVPYNANGSAENPEVWSFTTMNDMSIKSFPYKQGFEGEGFPPVGWVLRTDGFGNWSRTENADKSYEGIYSLAVFTTKNDTDAIIETPEVIAPADKDIQITFAWGNSVPVGLKSDQSVTNEGGDAVYFEARTPDTDWVTLATCSQEEPKWEKQKVLLTDYKGKRITFRWRYRATNVMKAGRAALDDIIISYVESVGVPVISYKEWYKGTTFLRVDDYGWNAGIVNYRQMKNSGEMFTLANEGEFDLKIKEVTFDTEFFTSTLAKDQIIKANEEIKFGIIFTGVKEQLEIEDALSIEFEDGQIKKFPITGSAIGENSYCYTFDDLTPFSTRDIYDFKLVDEDGYATFDNAGIHYPGKGSAYAFMVMNWEMADWRNLFPRSGQQMLMAANAPITGGKESELKSSDWLISKQVTPRAGAQLRFYAKSYGNEEDWDPHKLSVLVSTTDDNIGSFIVTSFDNVVIPCDPSGKEAFKECIIDLSDYADQKIYVAIHHTSYHGMVMFIDDIYFENFSGIIPPQPGAPVFMTDPITTGNLNTEYFYAFTVMDPDGDELDITVRKPAWMTYTPGENGGSLSGTPNAVGEHYVRIVATDGENETVQEFDVVVTEGNAIGTVSNTVSIYPNPATDVININGIYKGNVVLSDLSGKVVYRGSNVREIPVGNLSAGVYILQIDLESGPYKTKIVKK